MLNPKIITTADGSHTLKHPDLPEHYHSTFGAIRESQHVFIKSGLESISSEIKLLNILEVGFGTGLNAFLTLLWANKNRVLVNYTGIEAFPISMKIAKELNYPLLLKADNAIFLKMHSVNDEVINLSEYFSIQQKIVSLLDIQFKDSSFDVVYFDAFSPDTQPELWTEAVFSKLYRALKKQSVLTTYSTKGIVKRAMKAVGFKIEKLPGPPGKREILRALKDD